MKWDDFNGFWDTRRQTATNDDTRLITKLSCENKEMNKVRSCLVGVERVAQGILWDKDLSAGPYFTRPLFGSINVSAFCGIRLVVSVTQTAQVELRSGRAEQGLTLVHFSAHRKHLLWDELGVFSDKTSQNSTKRLRFS